MPTELLHHALNVGVVDKNKLFRVDLERMRLAAEDQTNIFCDAVGRAFLRPGTEYMGTALAKARILPFVAGGTDAFVLELTTEKLRVWDADSGDLVTRGTVSTTIADGDFGAATGWTLASTSGQTTSVTGGELVMSARAHGGIASAKQQVTVGASDQGDEHALRISVTRGPVILRIGSTEGGAEYLPNGMETTLFTGDHSIAFTPTGNFWLEFSSERQTQVKVASATIEAAGVMELATPWTAALLKKVRGTQSLDVMFVACEGVKQQRIERRGDTSWSVVDYDAEDGPFLVGRTADIKLTPGATEGNTTLTASKPFFTANHVGALFKVFHEGQKIDTYLAAAGEFTPTFLVTGITETNFEERKWTVTIAGTWVGTLRHERSFDGDDIEFHPFRRAQTVATVDITANATFTNDDNDDNAITYYRMTMTDYTSGEAQVTFTYDGGGGYGIARVVGYTSPTEVDIEILTPFKGTDASADWQEGAWSPLRGYPAGVAMHEGRLIWAGYDRLWGSVSDAYNSFDETFVGDAGPLLRSIALGGRNEARWMLPLSSLLIGCDSRVANVRTSSLDEILTPSNFAIKSLGKIGAASLTPVEAADDRALFAHASGNSIYEVSWSSEKSRYLVTPFSKLTTDLLSSGVADMGISTLPDQRIWVPTTDDNLVMVVFEPSQQVVAHIPVSTSAATDFIESVAVVPGTDQDRVWFSVKRVVNGSTVYYIERLALDSEAKPSTAATKCVDSHVNFGAGSATITGLDHLEGRTVVAWADGDAVNVDDSLGVQQVAKEFTVASGQIVLPSVPATGGCVGLKYRGRFKMARLAYSVGEATSTLKKKTVASVGFLLSDLCRSGLKLGTRFDDADHPLRSLHDLVQGQTIAEVQTGMQADEDMHSVSGEIELDPRVCLEMNSPKPVTVNSLILGLETHG